MVTFRPVNAPMLKFKISYNDNILQFIGSEKQNFQLHPDTRIREGRLHLNLPLLYIQQLEQKTTNEGARFNQRNFSQILKHVKAWLETNLHKF